MSTKNHVCPAENSWALNNKFRTLVHSPKKILGEIIKPGMKILDLGCGPGYFTVPMAILTGSEGSVTAVDLQEAMLNKIKTRIEGTRIEKRINLHNCTEKSIGINDIYDFALAFYMLHEVPNQYNFLKEIFDHLKPGAYFLLVEPKGHVSKPAFNNSLEIAWEIGFKMTDSPSIFFSQSAILKK